MIAPYMPLFVADYLADTVHLTAAENGAYLLLIMNYWQRQKALPDDDRKLAAIARMAPDHWKESRATIAEFFDVSGGEWRHKRIDAELAFIVEKSGKAAAAGRASADARRTKTTTVEPPLNDRSTTVQPSGKARSGKKEEGHTSVSAALVGRATPDEFSSLESELRKAAGAETSPSPGLIDVSPIIRCRNAGASVELDVLPTIRVLTARGHRWRTWAYAEGAIMDAKARRESEAPQGRATGPPTEKPLTPRQKLSLLVKSLDNPDDQSREHPPDRPPHTLLAAG